MRKKALEQKAEAAKMFRGQKERRHDSATRPWTGDYITYEDNFQLQDIMQPYMDEMVSFADDVLRLNKNGKLEKRIFLLTDVAFYLITRAVKKQVVSYSVTRRVEIAKVRDICVSTLSDGYLTIHVSGEHDAVLENDRKTELIMLMREAFQNKTGQTLQVFFNDTMKYIAKQGDTNQREVIIYRDEAAIPLVQLQETTKNKIMSFFSTSHSLRIGVPSGLPKDTDTTPRGFHNTIQRTAPAPAAARGGSRAAANKRLAALGGGMYDASAAEEYVEEPQYEPPPAPMPARPAPARGGMPPRGGGAPRGGMPPRGGGAPRGGMPPRGGGAPRGGMPPRGGGAPRGGMPPRGGGAPRGGMPPRGGGAPRGGMPPRGGMAPRAPPAAPAQPARPRCKALYPYQAQADDELTFQTGDVMFVVQPDDGGWIQAELNGRVGMAPSNYVQML